MRDLFEQDDGGWLQDAALLDRLVVEKLTAEAETIRAEGWKWIDVAVEFPYGHTTRLRHLAGETVALTEQEQASHDALRAEYDRLEAEYAQAEELPDEVDQRLGEIETALEAFDARPVIYDPAEIARAGVFVSVDPDGGLRVERGYVRPEDEAPVEAERDADGEAPEGAEPDGAVQRTVITIGGSASPPDAETPEEDDGIKPLPDRLVTELTAHRTLALRDALANDPGTAFVAVLARPLPQGVLPLFRRYLSGDRRQERQLLPSGAGADDTASAKAIDGRHQNWARQLPQEPGDLWDALVGFDRRQPGGALRPLRVAHRQRRP